MVTGNDKFAQKIKTTRKWWLFWHNHYILCFRTVLIYMASFFLAYFLAFYLRFEFKPGPSQLQCLFNTFGIVITVKLAVLYFSRQYRDCWFYASVKGLLSVIKTSVVALVVLVVINAFSDYLWIQKIPRSVLTLDAGLSIMILGGLRLVNRLFNENARRIQIPLERALLIGANKNGGYIANTINTKRDTGFEIVGFITLHPHKTRMQIGHLPILGTVDDLVSIAKREKIHQILVISGILSGAQFRDVYERCQQAGLSLQVIPMVEFQAQKKIPIRDININDLLKRAPISLDTACISNLVKNKRILVTGAGGSIGSEICRQLLKYNPQELVLLGRGENRIFFLERELRASQTKTKIFTVIADVSIPNRIDGVFAQYKPQIVFHAAANKHVPLMEGNVQEALRSNVYGTKVVADAADRHSAEKFIMISTDKAVNPTSIMGASKHLAERYVNAISNASSTKYIVTRFGNVLGSNGSVVPIFKQQIQSGGPITITDLRMTRFFMTIPEASQLVLEAAAMGKGGEVFVLDMGNPVKIVDLAKDMIRLAGLPENSIEIREVGLRPGEKLYEELYFDSEEMLDTKQPKLFAAKHREFDIKTVQGQFAELCQMFDVPSEMIRQKIKEFIPEYKNQ